MIELNASYTVPLISKFELSFPLMEYTSVNSSFIIGTKTHLAYRIICLSFLKLNILLLLNVYMVAYLNSPPEIFS